MPLLDLERDELKMLTDALDHFIVNAEAHARRTADPYVAAAIGANVEDFYRLRRKVGKARRPAPWPDIKRALDAMQTADPDSPALRYQSGCIKHHVIGCTHCSSMTI